MNSDDYIYPMSSSTGDPRDGIYCQNGLSVRDHTAILAMQGMLANPVLIDRHTLGDTFGIVARAYGLADAMIDASKINTP